MAKLPLDGLTDRQRHVWSRIVLDDVPLLRAASGVVAATPAGTAVVIVDPIG